MKYLRAIISSDTHTQNPLFKKDYQVQDVCAPFVRGFANTLATMGLLLHKEDYKAYVTPSYGTYQKQSPAARVDKTIKIKQTDPWINLEIEEPIQHERPIDFFTIDIIPKVDMDRGQYTTVKGQGVLIVSGQDILIKEMKIAYRTHVLVDELEYFWHRIERALAIIGPPGQKEQRYRKLYARDDDHANFEEGEMTAWEQDAADLIEIMPAESSPPEIPQKSLADFTILGAKKLVRGILADDTSAESVSPLDEQGTQPEIRILITYPTLEQLQQIARSGVRVEQGGALVGLVFEERSTHSYLVEISNYIPTEGAEATEVELSFTFESWQHQTLLLKEQYPDKRIVGWYHTHLDMVKKTFRIANQGIYTTPIFFSKDDLFTHRQFFREKWYVAMVLDPEGNLTFFQWIGDDIGESRRFYVIEPRKEA